MGVKASTYKIWEGHNSIHSTQFFDNLLLFLKNVHKKKKMLQTENKTGLKEEE